MNNTDKIANDVVLSYLKDRLELLAVYERDDCLDMDDADINLIYDKAADALKELAAFFERTIQ